VGSLGTRVSGSTGPIPLDCNRACLENLIDQYLKAVVAHDPSKLPLSKDVMYTENNQVIDVGDGFWKTAQGLGNYRHVFADPEFGQVAMMGTMMEAGAPLLMSLRLRVELGRITEIESIYFKPGGGGPNNIAAMDKMGKAEDVWFRTIPPAQRLPRQQMISIADAYFSGLQKNDGKGVNGSPTYPFTNDCNRIENGSPTTNVPAAAEPGAWRGQPVFSGLPDAVPEGLLLRRAEHPSPPLPAGRSGTRRGVDALHLRPGHGELGRAVRWHQAQLPGLQPPEQHPRERGVPDRERQDPPRGNDRPLGDVSHHVAMAWESERELKAQGSGLKAQG
jgi:hypothetical protein